MFLKHRAITADERGDEGGRLDASVLLDAGRLDRPARSSELVSQSLVDRKSVG